MTPEKNLSIAHKWFEAFNTHNLKKNSNEENSFLFIPNLNFYCFNKLQIREKTRFYSFNKKL